MGELGLQISLEMSPSPFLRACRLDHQFPPEVLGHLPWSSVSPVHVCGTSRWSGWRMLLPRGLRAGQGLHQAGTGRGDLCVTASLHLPPEKERLRD